jgi:hypothetical protein
MTGESRPGKIHLRIIDVMKNFPDGVSGGQIRHELEKEGLEPGNKPTWIGERGISRSGLSSKKSWRQY